MYLHANAKLGLAARFALVKAVEGGCSIRGAATRFNVSPATAHRWWHRWLEAGEEESGHLEDSLARQPEPLARSGHHSGTHQTRQHGERLAGGRQSRRRRRRRGPARRL